MRVISGIRKGHRIKGAKIEGIRPTEDKIKESIFNILGNIRDDSMVLDLFAGTGSIGIEFLSRRAKRCYFVDVSPKSISIIEENLIFTRLMNKAIIIKKSGEKAIEYLNREGKKFEYIYLDPPYHKHDLVYGILNQMGNSSILNKEGIIIIEHETKLNLENNISIFKKIDYRKYGDKSISFYKYI